MAFDVDKKNILGKEDKSMKGRVDSQIIKLVDTINSLNDYYTTSSCAGRVLLIVIKNQERAGVEYMCVSHSKADFSRIRKALEKVPKEDVWFRQEEIILHVCCRNLEAARIMLNLARSNGLKHSGIISIKNKIIVEIMSIEKMNTLISRNGKVLVDDNYLKILVKEANLKMAKNIERIKNLEKKI